MSRPRREGRRALQPRPRRREAAVRGVREARRLARPARRSETDLRHHRRPQSPLQGLRRHRRALHQSQPRALQPEDPERPGREDGEHRALRRHLRQQADDDERAGGGGRAATEGARGLHAGERARGDRAARLSGGAEADGRIVGTAAEQGERSRRRRNHPRAQGNARQLSPQHFLHPGIREEAGPRHPRVPGRAGNDLRDLPHLAELDHQHRPRRLVEQLPDHAGARRHLHARRQGVRRRRRGARPVRGSGSRAAGERSELHDGVPQQHRADQREHPRSHGGLLPRRREARLERGQRLAGESPHLAAISLAEGASA